MLILIKKNVCMLNFLIQLLKNTLHLCIFATWYYSIYDGNHFFLQNIQYYIHDGQCEKSTVDQNMTKQCVKGLCSVDISSKEISIYIYPWEHVNTSKTCATVGKHSKDFLFQLWLSGLFCCIFPHFDRYIQINTVV